MVDYQGKYSPYFYPRWFMSYSNKKVGDYCIYRFPYAATHGTYSVLYGDEMCIIANYPFSGILLVQYMPAQLKLICRFNTENALSSL